MNRLHAGAQRGQSLVEFAMLSLALLPLFLAIPLLGKYLDLAHSAESAARYAAFEATVNDAVTGRKTDARLAEEVRRRFFGTSDAPIKTDDVGGDFAAHRNALWVDHAGRPLLQEFASDVAVRTQRADAPVQTAPVALGNSGFGLSADSVTTAAVTVRPRNVAGLPPFDALSLEVRRHQVLLVDGWGATGTREVARRIAGGSAAVYPIGPLKLLGDTIGQLPTLVLDPPMAVGEVQPDIVPCDRLESGC